MNLGKYFDVGLPTGCGLGLWAKRWPRPLTGLPHGVAADWRCGCCVAGGACPALGRRAGAALHLLCWLLLASFLGDSLSAQSVQETPVQQKLGQASITEEPITQEPLARGQEIYRARCAECHGDRAQGVPEAYEDPLIGDESIGQLAARIAETMPEGDPRQCQGEDALAVAEYLHYNFYSEAAQLRNRPPRVGLARLTAEQLRQSLADLYEQFEGSPRPSSERGVKASYVEGDRWKKENIKIERVDPVIDFDFGHESPGEGIQAEAFTIVWQGGVRADVSGLYEIVVRSSCSFQLDFGRLGRQLIDNHVQSGDKTEFRRTLHLTAGRVYPFKINFVQRKRKTEQPPARISFAWVPPGGVEQVIPQRNLHSETGPPTFALQASLPPDDRSYGFERGVAVDRQWDASTTAAAIEFAEIAVAELWPAYLRRHRQDAGDTRRKMQEFLTQIVQTAFRGALDSELKERYIVKQMAAEEDDAEAIKRVLLVSLKSPRFLYPTLDAEQTVSQRVANRLALVLFDSLPSDRAFQQVISQGRLASAAEIRAAATERLDDYRLQAKVRSFLYEWLNIDPALEISKEQSGFPGFDPQLVSDLRQSLDAFLDAVVWSEESDYRQFFLADWGFTTQRMSDFYGPPWQLSGDAAPGVGLQPTRGASPVALEKTLVTGETTAGTTGLDSDLNEAVASEPPVFGLLTHPLLMSTLASHSESSPIHRGVFLIRYLLGRTLRPPAEAFSPLSPALHPQLTTRQRVALQTSPESCQVCHVKINGLGFTLENYDAVGRFRSEERQQPIDARGSYTTRAGDIVELNGVQDVAHYLAASDDAHRALVRRAFQHFVKQPAAAFGANTLDALTEKFRQSECNLRELIVEIAVVAALPPEQP
ncbi:MAG: DUF1588 domain-containing protein [Planctomycetales bacterium]|nr:DUF1588 domain-containing protein [Planctomycetales bacterium]